MAQNRLVVASDVGGPKELIQDGVNGKLFTAGDAVALATVISDLIEQKDQWQQYHKAGREYVAQERNWPTSVQRYSEVYETITR